MSDLIEVIVEIPKGSRNKYEMDEETGHIHLDRVLYSSVHYPTDYGFIPETRAEDGDHLDVLVLVEEPTFPGCRVRARPIGVLCMSDDRGQDNKLVAVPEADPRFSALLDLGDLQPHWLREIENFFASYKTLEDKTVEVQGWEGRGEALRIIDECRKRESR